ncbi:hypothetical protein S40288_10237, partial [Stachybotrys chartarum IBT 40288]
KPRQQLDKRQSNHCSGACDANANAFSIEAPHDNIWDGLTHEEIVGLLEWLHQPEQGLNLTVTKEAGAWDNTIGIIELLYPNKTDALAYLDDDGPLPARYARVGVFFGATEEPYIQAFVVGPLPVSEETTIVFLDHIYTKGSGQVPNYDADYLAAYDYKVAVAASIADITQDLLGVTVTGAENDTAIISGLEPLHREGDRIIDWIGFWVLPSNSFDDGTILLGGMWLKFDITGRDPSNWSVLGAVYNDIFYETLDELRAAWQKPGFVRLTHAVDGDFGSTARRGEELPLDTLPAPGLVESVKRPRHWVEIKVRASGYIQGAYYANNEEYGYHIHDALSGSMVNNEDEAKLNWAPNSASSYVIVNKDAVNPYGEYRGYKIAPNLGAPVYLTVHEAKGHGAEYLHLASRLGVTDWGNSVIWLNLGMHHVPTTSDLPNTVFTNAQAGIAIIPHNYLLSDPSRQISHSVYIDLTSGPAEESVYGGESRPLAPMILYSQQYPDLSEFPISEPLRKWPEGYAGGGA